METPEHPAWAEENAVEAAGTWARVTNALEVAMGGPTSGRLSTNRGFERDGVSPSIRLSPDGQRLAYVTLESRRRALLDERGRVVHGRSIHFFARVQDLERRTELLSSGPLAVVEIESFDGRTLVLLESPKLHPTRIVIDLDESLPPRPSGGP